MKNVGKKLLSIGLMLTMMFSGVNAFNYLAVGIEKNFEKDSQIYDDNEFLEKVAYIEKAAKEAKEAKERLQNCLRYPDCRNQLKCLEGDQDACNSIKLDKDFSYVIGALGAIGWNAANQVVGWVVRGALGLVEGVGRQAVRIFVRR